ncbi:MAG: SDR family oxidoreductase [Desulfobacteraceae bacterium]|nr:SDR family oxidoreductase [Desulfobacteraceae bacterium]MBC2758109.1 SDR family oxidoreductase [Desulfobacteraceae bacterium]
MKIFKDKVAIVTGAGSGIGKCLSEKLAGLGASVVLSDINKESCESVVAGIKSAGGKAYGEQLDVTDYKAFEKHIKDAAAKMGRIDYIFNNAGIAISAEVRDLEVEDWQKVIDVDLNGVFYGSLVAYKIMVKQGFGHIVNISSIEGVMPFPANAPYVAAKYAVLGFTQTLWVEAGHLGVNVSAVCPGIILTPIFDISPVIKIDREKGLAQYQPMFDKFGITPEKCAQIILKGVAKNKPIITVTKFARFLWTISRWMPLKVMKAVRNDYNKWRDNIRIEE